MAGNTLNAVMVSLLTNSGDTENVGVYSIQVTTSINSYILYDTWTLHYWNGLGIGSSPVFNVFYNFTDSNGVLKLKRVKFYFKPGQIMNTSYTHQTFSRF